MKNILKFFGRLLLVPVSWIPVSRLYGRIMRLRRPHRLALWMIHLFQKHYRVNMDEFRGKPEDYGSLADFFLRPLDEQKRPLKTEAGCILSPADGRLSELELVTGDTASQVKGWTYPLSLLLAEPIDPASRWYVATIYLSPRDYHRFHYPVSGRINGSFHGGTRLFPVNDFSVNRVKRLYIRNERVVSRFTLHDSFLYVVAVGATFVGGIGMKALPAGLPDRGRWQDLDLPVTQLSEMGHFAMGSTIIMVAAADLVDNVVAEKGKPVRVGEPLFKIKR